MDANKGLYIQRLAEFVAIPSVSAEPARRPDVVRAVHYAKAAIEALGGTVQLHETGAQPDGLPLPPILTATLGADPAKKTVLVYGHLDVQPAAKSDGWNTEPFVLTEVDGKLFGRGSTDDKGPVLAWLAAVEAFAATGRALPVNLRFCLEAMEESGSEGLEEFLASKPAVCANVDYSCISDNYWLSSKTPCLTYGLRGICYFTLSIECAKKDLHSGVFGGPVREGLGDLVKLLAGLTHADGSIAVAGIADTVRPVTAAEASTYAPIDFDVAEYAAEFGAHGLRVTDKAGVLMARWRFPTLSVHGVEGAFSGAGAKTVIPGRVIGKFSLRIVPDMTPADVERKVRAHVDAAVAALKTPNKVELSMLHGAAAWLGEVDGPNFAAARRAVKAVYGREPDLTREGGSIPPALWLEAATGAPTLLLPIGACDDSAHSTNEKFNVTNYINGVKVLGRYLHELAA